MEKTSNVKKTTLRKLLVAIFAVAILCPLAKAQTIGGDDLKIFEFNSDVQVRNKMVVADNGWIYLMVHSGRDADNSKVKIFRSKDDGATYEKLKDWSPVDDYRYQDFDIVVTGKDESDIKVWSVELMNKPGEYKSRVDVFCRDANLQNAVRKYHEDFSIVRLYDVAIATNYRSPSATGNGGNPFALAFAYTGFNSTNTQSFVDYVFSKNGGQNFTKELLYVQDGENKIGKVDLSLGSTSATMGHSTWPLMGVVFEMNKNGESESEIGFLSNFVDNDLNHKWAAPIKVSESNHAYSPKIQMMLDEENNTINGEKCHNFMITYSHYDSGNSNWDIRYVYPKPSFKYSVGNTPTINDLVEGLLISSPLSETNSSLGYDKGANNYLITYAQKEESGTNTLKYFWVNYNDIHTDFTPKNKYTYTSSANDLYTPQVDISPTKGLACWSWAESVPGKQTVWTDTEWSTSSDVEEVTMQQSFVQLSPNPAKDHIIISLAKEGEYKAMLHDTQGRTLAAFAFSGKEYRLSLQDFAKGIYLLRILTPTGDSYNRRFVIE